MKSRALMILCGASILLSIGALPGTRTPTLWEYGIYTESAGGFDWQDATRRVQAANGTHFFAQMGFPSRTVVDNLRPSRITALVLNHLGQRGWELVEVRASGTGNDTYWFRRPR